jgi:hypothetical protein
MKNKLVESIAERAATLFNGCSVGNNRNKQEKFN